MKITDELIDYIGVLSRLKLSETEKEASKPEIEKIINYMDILNTLDTDNIEALSHALPIKNVFREDRIMPSVPNEIILSNAPDKNNGCFNVPKAVE